MVLRRQVLKNASAEPRINCITTDGVVGGRFLFYAMKALAVLAPVRRLGRPNVLVLSVRQTHNYYLTFTELCIS